MLFLFAAFVVFLVCGVIREELSWRGVSIFLGLALAAFGALAARQIPPYVFAAWVGALDIALMLVVFKGDITIR